MTMDEQKSSPAERPGIMTTEFWLALAVAVMGGLAAAFSDREWAKVAGVIAAAISSVGYGVARAQVKSTTSGVRQ
jgi:hypothetical protein